MNDNQAPVIYMDEVSKDEDAKEAIIIPIAVSLSLKLDVDLEERIRQKEDLKYKYYGEQCI